ncbi:hypothetical protein [Cytobacillus sp. FSL R5-0596]|uniref:hypothetical protein n=1 Tax=Cytobacillus sp. FSL R5-0596 TaxID=2954696 RepID=UPI0030F71B71
MIKRKFDFKTGTKISSSEVNEELTQLVNAVNQGETNLEDTKKLAQMMKITTDDGGAKLNITNTTHDLLSNLTAQGIGLHTFYAAGGSKGLPGSQSVRGLAHFTSPNNGWAFAFDVGNNFYYNYLLGGKWLGWEKIPKPSDKSDVLWSGNHFMQDSQTIVPSKKLSECQRGWVLVWSDYDPSPDNITNDYHFVSTPVPKIMGESHSGKSFLCQVPNSVSETSISSVVKQLYVFNDKIVGHAVNNAEGNSSRDVVLRYVLAE